VFEGITKKRKNRLINYFGWGLIIICCAVFVFIGYDFNSGFLGTTGAAAQVNGEAISIKEYSDLLDRLENQGNRGTDSESQKKNRRDAIEILINQELVLQKSKELNIFVSDREVAQELMDIKGFQEDGKFSRVIYKRYLMQIRQSEQDFENMVRKTLLQRKMMSLIGSISTEIPLMEESDLNLDKAKINISYLAFNKFNSKTVSVPSEDDVKAFIAENEKKVKGYYDEHKEDYLQKEQVKAKHILIKSDGKDKEADKKALEKIQALAKEVIPANFADMAKKHSEGPSNVKGGDLGFFERGRMVPEFDKAVFSMEMGTISEPVKTSFGYHLILAEEKKAEEQQKLEDVQESIARTMIQDERFSELAKAMETALKAKDMDKITELSEANGLKWKDTGLFSINEEYVPGVGKVQPFMDAAMNLTYKAPMSTNLLRYMNNRYILKLKEAKIDENAKPKANPQMDFLKQFMDQQRSSLVMQSWIDSLKKESDIQINPTILN